MPSNSNPYAAIPSIEQLLQRADIQCLIDQAGHDVVRDSLRRATAQLRADMRAGKPHIPADQIADQLAQNASEAVNESGQSSLVSVINLTGTVLHTNLGRATLPPAAISALIAAAGNSTNIEYDLMRGARGDRDDHIEALLCEMTGAEAATVLNNNAAAVMLSLNSLALNREVPVSRGELIEIGGSFRMPQIMERAGCRLIEVGTTNRTHLGDYRDAISAATAALMIVHPSNFAIQGFTTKPSRAQIASLAHEHGIPLIDDLGSGTLIDLEQFGLPHEVTVREAIQAGADIVTFSGDKLLGGPQAGVIVGRADLIKQINSNPMKRAMRVDKLILSALEAVLRLYRNPKSLGHTLPVMRLLSRPLPEIDGCAHRICDAMTQQLAQHAQYSVTDCHSQIGSGALPGDALPSRAVAIQPAMASGTGLNHWSKSLRMLRRPVIGRIHEDRLLLDMRTLEDEVVFVTQFDELNALLSDTVGA